MSKDSSTGNRLIKLLNVCFAESDLGTKQEFAEKLNTTYLQLYRWMEGKTRPRKKAMQEICDACGVDYMEFMSFDADVEHPYRCISVGGLVSSYKKVSSNGDQCGECNLLVKMSGVLVSDHFYKAGLCNEFVVVDSPNKEDFDIVSTISFIHATLLDLVVQVFGADGCLMIRMVSKQRPDKAMVYSPLSDSEIFSLATSIKRNYQK